MSNWMFKTENLFKGEGFVFQLFTIWIYKAVKGFSIGNLAMIWQQKAKPQPAPPKPKPPKPKPLVMDEIYFINGHFFKLTYINKGRKRFTFQYLSTQKEIQNEGM